MTKEAYSCLFGAILLLFTFGNMSTAGNLLPYLTSYLRRHLQIPVDDANVLWVGVASQMAFGFSSILGGLIDKHAGTKVTSFVGSCIVSYGLLLSYATIQCSLPLLVVSAGLTVGFGTAIAYCPPMYAVVKWFPGHEGLLTGVVMAAYYLGYMLSTLLQTFYLNPLSVSTDIEGYFQDEALLMRVPSLFLWMAGFSFTLQVAGVMLIPRRQAPVGHDSICERIGITYDDCSESTHLLTAYAPSSVFDEVDVRTSELVQNTLFRKLWLTNFLNCVVGVALITIFKSFGESYIKDDEFLSLVASTQAVTFAIGGVMWGFAIDKHSYKSCMLVTTCLLTIFTCTLPLVKLLGKIVYTVWGTVLFFASSGNLTVIPTVVKRTFGTKHVTTNVGLLLTAQGVSALFVAVGVQSLLDSIGFSGLFVIASALTFIAMLLTLSLPEST